MEIRVMTIDDYDGAYALWRRTEGIGLMKADERDGICRFLERNPGMSFVAVEADKIIGTALGGHDGRKGYIFHAVVEMEYQSRGTGKLLIESIKRALKAEGILRLALLVYKGNAKGNGFWRRTGWQLRDDLNYYTLDIDT